MSVEFQNNVARRPSSKQSNVCHPSKVDVKTKVASKVYLVGGAVAVTCGYFALL